MPSRRRVLSGCVTGVAAALAGCFGNTDGDPATTDANDTSDPDATTAATTDPTTTDTDDGVLYEREWTGISIDKGSGWIHETPQISEFAAFTYTVSAADGTGFDVYVFEKEYTVSEIYEPWINAPSGMRPQDGGIVGLSGVTARNVEGEITKTSSVDAGRYWIAVDHSNFNGGVPRAQVDGDSPDTITVDVSLRFVPAI